MDALAAIRKLKRSRIDEIDIEAAKKKMADVGLDKIGQPKMLRGDEKQAHVMANLGGGKYKYIKFGQAGADQQQNPQSPKQKARRKAFKDRHAKNIARGPISPAYWADRFLW